MSDAAELERLRAIKDGRLPNGIVTLRDFDRGIVETMGAKIFTLSPTVTAYFLVRPEVSPPPGLPGVPITFAFPEDVFSHYRVPVVSIRRDDMPPAMERYQNGALQYAAPSPTATKKKVNGQVGFTERVSRAQADPYDITYSITVQARHRGSVGLRNQANAIHHYIMQVYPARTAVIVTDSLGLKRSYTAFQESNSSVDELIDIADRTIGFNLTLRVEAEIDLAAERTNKTVFQGRELTVDPLDF